jgi:hypothetical protein
MNECSLQENHYSTMHFHLHIKIIYYQVSNRVIYIISSLFFINIFHTHSLMKTIDLSTIPCFLQYTFRSLRFHYNIFLIIYFLFGQPFYFLQISMLLFSSLIGRHGHIYSPYDYPVHQKSRIPSWPEKYG